MAARIPAALPTFQGAARPGKLKITEVEILKLEGHQDAFTGVERQYQAFQMGKDPLAGEALWARSVSYGNQRGGQRDLGSAGTLLRHSGLSSAGRAFAAERGSLCELSGLLAGAGQGTCTYQKWFLAYGPGDGPAGLKKNVDLVKTLRESVGDEWS
jgi:hypothetical protein